MEKWESKPDLKQERGGSAMRYTYRKKPTVIHEEKEKKKLSRE